MNIITEPGAESWSDIKPFTADDLLPNVSCRVVSADTKGEDRVAVVMELDDQTAPQELEFPVGYLRMYCECSHCFNHTTLSHHSPFEDLLQPTSVSHISVKDDGLEIQFNDDHTSSFPAIWLYHRRFTVEGNAQRLHALQSDGQVEWCDNYKIQYGSYKELCEAPQGFIDFGSTMVRDGIYVLTDCPDQKVSLTEFLDKIGLVPLLTHYGVDFDVRNNPKPNNLAYTNRKLELHVDQTYLSYTPRIQVLRCLQPAEVGGENVMSDGIKAANLLRKRNPDMFHTLTTQKIGFEDILPFSSFAGKHVGFYSNTGTVINVDENGNPAHILWNPMVRSSFFEDGLNEFDEWLKAIRVFYKICYECSITVKTKSGEALVFDNMRVLHSRLAYNTKDPRHLDGIYTDWDHIHSRLRVAKIMLAQQTGSGNNLKKD